MCCPAGSRTPINGFRVRCPTIRRPGKWSKSRQTNTAKLKPKQSHQHNVFIAATGLILHNCTTGVSECPCWRDQRLMANEVIPFSSKFGDTCVCEWMGYIKRLPICCKIIFHIFNFCTCKLRSISIFCNHHTATSPCF